MNLESEFFFSSNNRLSTYAVRGIKRPSSDKSVQQSSYKTELSGLINGTILTI